MEESVNDKCLVTAAIAREMSGGLTSRCQQDIQKLEYYLPLLENLVHHINLIDNNQQMISWISHLKIRWSSVLTSSSIFNLKGPKFYQFDNIHFELGMTLFVYGALLREQALEVLPSDLVHSTSLFRKAAGVYTYLAEEVLNHIVGTQKKPPEATSHMSSVMSLICLAEAQAVTTRKAEENGNTDGLLAKLHYGVTDLMARALVILQSTTKECNDISPRLMDFVLTCKSLHELRSYKYLAESLRNEGKIGNAIGVLHRALSNSQKNQPREDSWKQVYKHVFDDMTWLLQKYQHENEFVWHDKVPHHSELPSPKAVKIVGHIPYQPQKWERTLVFKL
ncbi:hypothetical protein F511_35916 [Dorcoceras hygrometricum]|uniref:BRO1 domain-containing protein n=1 Tax=Dorcoceras hygrometricum TaxID=472368 RepID=A0A2Z7BUM9_9LAMI|nr:hypothetical protein F511_35916 [Dorcoceras hygrometricum]